MYSDVEQRFNMNNESCINMTESEDGGLLLTGMKVVSEVPQKCRKEILLNENENFTNTENSNEDSLKLDEEDQQLIEQDLAAAEKQAKWTEAETLFLLETMRRHQIHSQYRSDMPEFFWKQVILEMNSNDTTRVFTYRQCQNKYNGMKRTFRTLIESGRESSTSWPYFSVMEELLNRENEIMENANASNAVEYLDEKFRWPTKATLVLLEELKRQSGTIEVRHIQWHRIVHKLSECGYNVTVSQCNNKFTGLKRTYNSMLTFSDTYKRQWPFFHLMDELLKSKLHSNYQLVDNDNVSHDQSNNQENSEPPNADNPIEYLPDETSNWSNEEVMHLLTTMIQEWESPSRVGSFWQRVVDVMNEQCNKSPRRVYTHEQCCDTYKKMLQNGSCISELSFIDSSKIRMDNDQSFVEMEHLKSLKKYLEKTPSQCENANMCAVTPLHAAGTRWTRKAVSVLIGVVRSALKSNEIAITDELWKAASKNLAKCGISQTPNACQVKWSKLLSDYKIAKKSKKKWLHFKIMDELFRSTKPYKKRSRDKTTTQTPVANLKSDSPLIGYRSKPEKQENDSDDGANLLETAFGFDADAWPSDTSLSACDGGAVCRCCLLTYETGNDQDQENMIKFLLHSITDIQPVVSKLLPCVLCQSCYDQAVSLYKFRLRCRRANDILANVIEQMYTNLEKSLNLKDDFDTLMIVVSDEPNKKESASVETTNIDAESSDNKGVLKLQNIEKLNKHVASDDLNAPLRGIEKKETPRWKSPEERKKTRWKANIHKKIGPKYKCSKYRCRKVFTKPQHLQYHLRNHGDHKNKCGICGRTYYSKQRLWRHCLFHHNSKLKLRCRYCNLLLPDYNVNHQHHQSVNDKWSYPVEAVVAMPFNATDEAALKFKIHSNSIHEFDKCVGEGCRKTSDFLCHYCGTFFDKLQDYKKHACTRASEHFMCSECGEIKFTTKGRLLMHLEKFHNIQPKMKEATYAAARKHQCDQCGKLFRTKTTLEIHGTIHDNQLCGICGRTVPSGAAFRRHMRHHDNVDKRRTLAKYSCNVCGLVCLDKQTLLHHIIRIHERVKKFKCKTCDKAFWTLGNLKEHEHRHLGEKPFTCELCGLCLVSARALLLHERARHTGYKPHHCHLCGASFINVNRKNVHLKIKHGPPNFECSLCGKLFHLHTRLRMHIRKVHQKSENRKVRQMQLTYQRAKQDNANVEMY